MLSKMSHKVKELICTNTHIYIYLYSKHLSVQHLIFQYIRKLDIIIYYIICTQQFDHMFSRISQVFIDVRSWIMFSDWSGERTHVDWLSLETNNTSKKRSPNISEHHLTTAIIVNQITESTLYQHGWNLIKKLKNRAD